jgi:predicted SAM-dependent methyltransferase
MSAYSAAKRIYYRAKNYPVIGPVCVFFSAFAKQLLIRFSASHNSTSELANQVDTVIRATSALQKSVNHEFVTVRNRIEFIRMELFESIQLNNHNVAIQNVRQIILNQEKYDAICQSGCVRINIGCGHKPLPEYLNIDLRDIPGVDMVGDAMALPFAPSSLTEIFSAHLLEHFTQLALKKRILPYWRDLLSDDGRIRIVVPDAESMIKAHINDEMSFADLHEVTFGSQDYDSDYHKTMFTANSLKCLLQQVGFKNINIVTTNRINGKCREMEIVAEK